MATKAQAVPSETNSFASDLAGIPSFLIDPEGAARRVRSKWFWIAPVVLSSILAVVAFIYITPYALHAASVSPIPDGVTAEQYAKGVAIGMKFNTYLSPVFLLAFYAIEALLLLGMSAVLGANAKFGQLFNLAAGCGIIQSLSGLASMAILHFKG